MLVERWDPVIFIVFDLFHTRYNPADAHIPGRNDLPVITLVRISRRDRIRSFSPRPIDVVNEALCQAHDENGWEGRPPFREDRAGGAPRPVYAHPRSGERTQ